jgi:hypothetical protein
MSMALLWVSGFLVGVGLTAGFLLRVIEAGPLPPTEAPDV